MKANRLFCRPDWLLVFALFATTLLAYSPAWNGNPIWDDDQHLTREALRSIDGLWRIWFDIGATQQYYPITHSAFWLEYRLWGLDPTGYHVVNVLLHALAAILLWTVLGFSIYGFYGYWHSRLHKAAGRPSEVATEIR